MTLEQFNTLSGEEAGKLLGTCCGSGSWVKAMTDARPFADARQLAQISGRIWYESCGEVDWREAFTHHPKIGDVKSLKEKFTSTAHLAGNEQASVQGASDEVINDLAHANHEYEKKNGFIFIVSATGKSAHEMLAILSGRLQHSAEEEMRIAMGEQMKISLLRLQKSIEADWSSLQVSHLTTHVLDTASGKPAGGVFISLKDAAGKAIACGITNADGRIGDLLPRERLLPSGVYHMLFETGLYFSAQGHRSFYPRAEICFEIFDNSHYHIPLLLSPYGYTTYRGS